MSISWFPTLIESEFYIVLSIIKHVAMLTWFKQHLILQWMHEKCINTPDQELIARKSGEKTAESKRATW